MMKQPIKGQEGWFKDIQNGSIDCGDTSEYQKYMKAYRAQQEKEKQVETLQNDVSALKSELGDIKSLLLTLVQNQKV